MEKKWEPGMSNDATLRLAIETLLEVVEDASNIEISIGTSANNFESVDEDYLVKTVATIKEEKEAEEARKKKKAQ